MTYDYRQRFSDHEETLRAHFEGHQASLWTALPGIIESVDLGAVTVSVQPSIQCQVSNPDGSKVWTNLPIIPDVPIFYPRGGGYTLTFPIKQGDECLLVFSSRCIDAWWQQGGVQKQLELRMHDLSDGFALVGPMSQAKKISGISANTTQLRADTGSLFVELDSNGGLVNITAPTKVHITAPTLVIDASSRVTINTGEVDVTSGLISQTGEIKAGGDVVAGAISLQTHQHTGVQTGTGISGPPIP
jgi:phage baseplate assembly protein gpV